MATNLKKQFLSTISQRERERYIHTDRQTDRDRDSKISYKEEENVPPPSPAKSIGVEKQTNKGIEGLYKQLKARSVNIDPHAHVHDAGVIVCSVQFRIYQYCSLLVRNVLLLVFSYDDDDVELNVLGCRVDILGSNCDPCIRPQKP